MDGKGIGDGMVVFFWFVVIIAFGCGVVALAVVSWLANHLKIGWQ